MLFIISSTMGRPIPANGHVTETILRTPVGGYASLDIKDAKESQCKTSDGLPVAECKNGSLHTGTNFSGRISGSCDKVILGPVDDTDFQRDFICDDLGHQKTCVYRLIKVSSEVSEATITTAGVTKSEPIPISSQSEGGQKKASWGLVLGLLIAAATA